MAAPNKASDGQELAVNLARLVMGRPRDFQNKRTKGGYTYKWWGGGCQNKLPQLHKVFAGWRGIRFTTGDWGSANVQADCYCHPTKETDWLGCKDLLVQLPNKIKAKLRLRLAQQAIVASGKQALLPAGLNEAPLPILADWLEEQGSQEAQWLRQLANPLADVAKVKKPYPKANETQRSLVAVVAQAVGRQPDSQRMTREGDLRLTWKFSDWTQSSRFIQSVWVAARDWQGVHVVGARQQNAACVEIEPDAALTPEVDHAT